MSAVTTTTQTARKLAHHVCVSCGTRFARKDALTRHMQSTKACGTGRPLTIEERVKAEVAEQVSAIRQEIGLEQPALTETAIINLVDRLHNRMRNDHAVVGPKALHDIIRMLCIRFIQPYIQTGQRLHSIVQPETYLGIDSRYPGQYPPGFNPHNLQYLDVYQLLMVADTGDDFKTILFKVWDILALNPMTKEMFKLGNFFNISAPCIRLCLTDICKVLKDIDFDHLDNDVQGLIYEHFTTNYSRGSKDFGQFFTPRRLIRLIQRINKEHFDHQPLNIYDPCMGTGGFLTEMYKEHRNTIQENEIYGGELEPDTFGIGLMNIVLTTGSMCHVTRQDSFRDNKNKKFDLIGTNPPFGVKNLKYDTVLKSCAYSNPAILPARNANNTAATNNELQAIDPAKMYPINTNDGSALFLQHCCARLADGGLCNIVLPDGQLFTGARFAKLREWFIDNHKLLTILSVPSGVFIGTGVKTVVLFFTKGQDEQGQQLKTDMVEFYSTQLDCATYSQCGAVSYAALKEKQYKIGLQYYGATTNTETLIHKTKRLGDLCNILAGKTISRSNLINGEYDVIGGGKQPIGKHNQYNCDENTILCSASGSAGFISRYPGKVWASDCFRIIPKSDEILNDYLYYYLKNIQDDIYRLQYGSSQPHVRREDLEIIQIPVPPNEIQAKIVSECDGIIQKIKQYESEIEKCRENVSAVLSSSLQ